MNFTRLSHWIRCVLFLCELNYKKGKTCFHTEKNKYVQHVMHSTAKEKKAFSNTISEGGDRFSIHLFLLVGVCSDCKAVNRDSMANVRVLGEL